MVIPTYWSFPGIILNDETYLFGQVSLFFYSRKGGDRVWQIPISQKRALATSLKELMLEQPFDKINVAQICARCNMNRKSFYYHFKDKYDLVNWIFDTEFIALMKDENLAANYPNYKERWVFIEKICGYFYENHAFYRKSAQIKRAKLLQ